MPTGCPLPCQRHVVFSFSTAPHRPCGLLALRSTVRANGSPGHVCRKYRDRVTLTTQNQALVIALH